MNKSKLGRLTIVILIAVGVVVVPWWMGGIPIVDRMAVERWPSIPNVGFQRWVTGFLVIIILAICSPVLLILYPLINYIKHGK